MKELRAFEGSLCMAQDGRHDKMVKGQLHGPWLQFSDGYQHFRMECQIKFEQDYEQTVLSGSERQDKTTAEE
jgi:hypothetical protein